MSSQPPARTVFFTHNWGENNENHNHCRDIAQALKREGIPVWFDEDRMEGQVADAMVQGINDSDVLLIAVTSTYIAKINGKNLADNCLREFNYALDQPRFADKFVCIVTDENALDTRLWADRFKMKVHNPLAINLCASLGGEERDKNLRELATLLKRKLAHNDESEDASIEAAQNAFAKMQVRPDFAWGADTSFTIERLTVLLDMAEIPKPREAASVLIEDGINSLKKLSAMGENDLRELQITAKNSKLIFDCVIAKLRQTKSYEAELEAANEAKTIMFWALMARNAQETAAGCNAINRFLVNNNERDYQALYAFGCNEVIVVALQRYAADARFAEQACAAIGAIPKDFAAEYKKLGEIGACEAVVAALQRFGVENAKMAALGCLAIRSLTRDDANRQKLGQIGACEVVVAALKRFGAENADVAHYGCWAIGNLAVNDANEQKLVEIGACEEVVAVLKRFGEENAQVAEQGCAAIGNLAAYDANKQKLGRLGACEAVVAALKRFGAENAKVAKNGCRAIGNLANDNSNNRKKLRQLGARAVVSNCLENEYKARTLMDDGCQII